MFVIFLAVTLMFLFPLEVLAQTNIFESTETTILSSYNEVSDMREEHVKYFQAPNGMYLAALYNEPVHYVDSNGEWLDIDNSLTLTQPQKQNLTSFVGTTTDVSYYENAANSFKVRLPNKLSNTIPVQVSHEEHTLSFRFLDAEMLSGAIFTGSDNTSEQKAELQSQARNSTDAKAAEELERQALTLLSNKVRDYPILTSKRIPIFHTQSTDKN